MQINRFWHLWVSFFHTGYKSSGDAGGDGGGDVDDDDLIILG